MSKKSSRAKPDTYATAEEFTTAVDVAAGLTVIINYLEAKRDTVVLRVTERYGKLIADKKKELRAIMPLAEKYAEEHRKELLPDETKRKSAETKGAIFGFEIGKRAVKTMHGIKEGTAIELMREQRLDGYVRLVPEIAKDKILIACHDNATLLRAVEDPAGNVVFEAPGQPKMEPVKLSEVGLKIEKGESFYVKARVQTAEPVKAEAAA